MATPGISKSVAKALLPATWKNLFYPPEKNEYVYFDHAQQYPWLAAGVADEQRHLVKIAWAADAAMLAYGRYGQKRMETDEVKSILTKAGLIECEFLGDWSGGNGTQGYFASNNDSAIMAFRGTERDDADDVAVDALVGMSPEEDVVAGTGVEQHSPLLHRLIQSLKGLTDVNGCWVHFGFQRAINQVWNRANDLITDYRKAHPEICFTGHSLGAALATLAVSRFTGGNASLYTIGSPRTGNAAFCTRVLQRADRGVFRFVNCGDLVTHVPIDAPIYQHVETSCYLIATDGGISCSEYKAPADFKELGVLLEQLPTHGDALDLNASPPSELVDHSPARYCMKLRGGLEKVAV